MALLVMDSTVLQLRMEFVVCNRVAESRRCGAQVMLDLLLGEYREQAVVETVTKCKLYYHVQIHPTNIKYLAERNKIKQKVQISNNANPRPHDTI